MKKLTILAAFIALSFAAKAQTPVVDTLVKGITSVRINPVKASFQDTVLSVFLGAYVVADNLKNSATFYWQLMTPLKDSSGTIIGAGQVTNQGNYTMTASQYSQWCSDQSCQTWPFTCIAEAYGLTFPTVSNGNIQKK